MWRVTSGTDFPLKILINVSGTFIHCEFSKSTIICDGRRSWGANGKIESNRVSVTFQLKYFKPLWSDFFLILFWNQGDFVTSRNVSHLLAKLYSASFLSWRDKCLSTGDFPKVLAAGCKWREMDWNFKTSRQKTLNLLLFQFSFDQMWWWWRRGWDVVNMTALFTLYVNRWCRVVLNPTFMVGADPEENEPLLEEPNMDVPVASGRLSSLFSSRLVMVVSTQLVFAARSRE